MDEKLVRSFAKKTLKLLKKEDKHKNLMQKTVFYCHRVLTHKKRNEKYMLLHTNPHIKVNKSIQLSHWFDFLKESDPEIITPVIFHKILNVSDVDIAKGLNISNGTLRYRLGKGLMELGEILKPGFAE